MFATLAALEACVVTELSPWDGGYDVEAIAQELEDTYHLVGKSGWAFTRIPESELAEIIHSHDYSLTEA